MPGEHAQAWRLAAWLVSFLIYTAHFRYERVRPSSATACRWRCTSRPAVAIGAFAVAVAVMMRSIARRDRSQPTWLLALVLFPAVTAVPAFLVALVAGVFSARRDGGAD